MNADWFAEERGINKETLDRFGVKFLGKETIFPYAHGEKARYFDEEGKRRFRFTKGMKPSLFGLDALNLEGTVFLCEGETDTMRLWQEMEGKVSVIGLGGIDTWRDEFATHLKEAEHVFVILDNDADYLVQAQVDKAWMKIRRSIGTRARRLKLPSSVKDVCEFFEEGYDVDDLRELASRGGGESRFSPLDLNQPATPPNWLLEGLFAMGDVSLESGASGLGKSWLTMGLTVAVADGWDEFLGLKVHHQGRVLYFDEENPEDVVKHRLKQLGLKNKGNIRYIWNNGIRLDRNPDVILEEAMDYQPTLIVLDSLTRIHSGEENSVGDMAPLLNDCIRPLARDTGAAVILIHHHDKQANGPRGSGDILSSVDGAVDCFATHQPDVFRLTLSKSRRRVKGEDTYVRIKDVENDRIELEAVSTIKPPF